MLNPANFRRFLAKITVGDDCWLWTAALDKDGYGRIKWNGKSAQRAHRVSYEIFVGPIPRGLEIDHLCKIRHCVRPNHLEAVTHLENLKRGGSLAALAPGSTPTHCKRGHAYDERTYVSNGFRTCRPCALMRAKQRRARA